MFAYGVGVERMSVVPAVVAFSAGALVSLAVSWVLVSRLERVGERLGLSEALLGIVAALAADAPEVTAAVSAMAGGQQRLGAGVIIGSNVFNLAALLGLGAVVAGRIGLHRKVVLLGGSVAMCVAGVCLAVVLGVVPPAAGCLLGLLIVALYAAALGVPAGAWPGCGCPGPGSPGCGPRWPRKRQNWNRRSGPCRGGGPMWLSRLGRWSSWSRPA